MPVISSIFLVAAWVLAVVIGPQSRPWTWGPAMVALGIAVVAAVPVIWKRGKVQADGGLLAMGLLAAAWFAWRAWFSPVWELGQADLLLLAGVVGAFVSVRAIAGNVMAERILGWGMALLLLASVVVLGRQVVDPKYTPVFRSQGPVLPAGFFSAYNEGANYLIACSMVLVAAAMFGRMALAVAGLAGVWFTRSRGGILGAAVACGVLAALVLMLGKRRNARWFGPALIAIPVIAVGIGVFLFMGWQSAQRLRFAGSGVSAMMDNSCRLYFLGVALSCIGLHPLAGGGSRSYGWECFRFLDGKSNGDIITHNPEFVHNEWVQSATDYGLAGAGLLGGFLLALMLAAILRILFEAAPEERDGRDAWRIGALAAFVGMLVQSCFSFVFHMMPGAVLLGICLGQMSRSAPRQPAARTLASRMLLTIGALASVVLLFPAGWTGCRVLRVLWPTYFGDPAAISSESRIDALGDAIRLWPQAAFYQARGRVLQDSAGSAADSRFREYAERAIKDYQEASRRNSHDPWLVINRAELLSQLRWDTEPERLLGDAEVDQLRWDAEAEKCFVQGIAMQGGMEPAFRAHFRFAAHYQRKGWRQFRLRSDDPFGARGTLELAAEQIETAARMHCFAPDMKEPRLHIHELLGNVREAAGDLHETLGNAREAAGDEEGAVRYFVLAAGDRADALQSYVFAAALPNGNSANYLVGLVLEKIAIAELKRRDPGKALAHFIEARSRIESVFHESASQLPKGATLEDRTKHIAAIDRTIEFLRGAKIEPEK